MSQTLTGLYAARDSNEERQACDSCAVQVREDQMRDCDRCTGSCCAGCVTVVDGSVCCSLCSGGTAAVLAPREDRSIFAQAMALWKQHVRPPLDASAAADTLAGTVAGVATDAAVDGGVAPLLAARMQPIPPLVVPLNQRPTKRRRAVKDSLAGARTDGGKQPCSRLPLQPLSPGS